MDRVAGSILAGLASETCALSPSNAEDQVRALERRWNDTYAKNDLKTYFCITRRM